MSAERVLLILCLASACGKSTDSARQAIEGSERFLTSAVGILERYDRDHQISIARDAATAGDPDRGRRELAAYRKQLAVATGAIIGAQALLATGPALLALVDEGVKARADMDAYLKLMFEFLQRVRESLAAIGVVPP